MEKREFYTLEDLKEFLKFDNTEMKLSQYCEKEKLSMVIPLGTTLCQSVPPFFKDTSPNTNGSIIYKDTNIFSDVKEIVDYWISEIPKASKLLKISSDNPQLEIEFIVKYMIAFSKLCKKRKSFPIDISESYKIEELWMREGYISIINIRHIRKGFTEEEKQDMKDIKSSFFLYIKDSIDMM